MSVDILKLKALAEAAKRDQYDCVALNDYGMAMPPAITLELIAEIERHRQVNAEGCKPDLVNPDCDYCAGARHDYYGDNCQECEPPADAPSSRTAAERDVLAERRRQVEAEGYTPEHDDQYHLGELAEYAAVHAILAAGTSRDWPHLDAICDWPVKTDEPRRMLVKASALILAEIESLDRQLACEVVHG